MNFLKFSKIKKTLIFFNKFYIGFKKYFLFKKYFNKYCDKNLFINYKIKLFFSFFNFRKHKKNNSNKHLLCDVRGSKIIFNCDQNKLIFIFDRPIVNNYWLLRDQWSQFHNSPKYKKIDEYTFYQEKSSGFGSLLILDEENLSIKLLKYLTSQIEYGNNYGNKIILSKFIKKPYKFLSKNNYLENFPGFLVKKIECLVMSSKILTLVPSIVEPWPNITNEDLEFSDLSPIEFSHAPILHDFCYMIMKHEMYGSRNENHQPFIFKLFKEVENIENKNSYISSGNLNALAKKIHAFVGYNDFLNAYLLMTLFHCYVKFFATGKFLLDDPEQRLLETIKRHLNILIKIMK